MGFIDNEGLKSKANIHGYEKEEQAFKTNGRDKGYPSSMDGNNPIKYTDKQNTKDKNYESQTKENIKEGEIYKVKSGDTLSATASKFGLDYKELAEYNNISNPNLIDVNQEIKIPGANANEEIKNVNIKAIAQSNIEEIKSAKYRYLSDKTYMALNNINVNGYDMNVAHIYITNPSQLKCVQSESDEGETITSMAKRTPNSIIGTVGGFFLGGRQNLARSMAPDGSYTNKIYILDGKLVDTYNNHNITSENINDAMNTTAGGQEICIDKNGKIFYAPSGVSAKELIDKYKVVNTFTSHEARRLDHGEIIQEAEWGKEYDRTYLCMKKPGEYYILQGYCTPGAVTTYAKDVLGAEFCGSLEQGSATAMNIKGETVRNHDGYKGIGNALFITD